MQELIAAKPADLLSTYFRKALPFHPDVAEDREKASQRFWQLSEAYWRLAAGSSVVPQDFSEQAILELWLREFAFEESGLELPALIAKELQMSTALEREQRHYEACTLARGLIPGERLQCAICGFQVRYHEQMREHMGEHEGLRGFWADRAIKLSTQSLGRAGASDDSTFQLSDGSWVQFKDLPDVQLPELDTIQPDEVVLRRLREVRPGIAAYLESEGDPDLSAALRYVEVPTSPDRSSRNQTGATSRRRRIPNRCRCGFSCGTKAALERHFLHYAHEPGFHKPL
ncbi:unnamed protein product [Cladocopium goreaui]|uniref:C2H2-type domain-containing protein n=1 Tax=Cladocopium goreaui TaxID=2562237 RepID=A0A9P1CL25_9DINO|nr:unnamed protein product [Cladocopium goreaui]|mmetsp:Transcript_10887/g.23962  ORF Transcript_10887/g.23962 Transcript_10887/m.23962 type:complete len:286 (+) Transcript_10887:42-899(+)